MKGGVHRWEAGVPDPYGHQRLCADSRPSRSRFGTRRFDPNQIFSFRAKIWGVLEGMGLHYGQAQLFLKEVLAKEQKRHWSVPHGKRTNLERMKAVCTCLP